MLVVKNGSEHPFQVVSPASFVCAEGNLTVNEQERERLAAAFDSGGVEFVRTLVWKKPVDPARCWYAASDRALSYEPPRERQELAIRHSRRQLPAAGEASQRPDHASSRIQPEPFSPKRRVHLKMSLDKT